MRRASPLAATLALVAACASTDDLAAAHQQTAQAQIQQIRSALDVYYVSHFAYPTEAQGLAVLVAERQLPSLPTDPWGRAYAYRLAAGAPEVWSFGRDGTPGGTGADADVTSPTR